MNEWLSRVDRAQIIRATAIYLIIYAVVNACGGLVFGLVGGLAAGVGVVTNASGLSGSEGAAVASSLATIGGLSILLGLLYLVSVPVFAVAAWGLYRRKAWARMGAVIALGFSILLSVVTLNNGIGGIIWILISGFGIYLFWSDEGIKRELSN